MRMKSQLILWDAASSKESEDAGLILWASNGKGSKEGALKPSWKILKRRVQVAERICLTLVPLPLGIVSLPDSIFDLCLSHKNQLFSTVFVPLRRWIQPRFEPEVEGTSGSQDILRGTCCAFVVIILILSPP